MHELINYLQSFDKPPFLALPKKLEMVFLRYIEERRIFMPCQFINIEDYQDYVEIEAFVYLKNHFNFNYYLISRMMNVLPSIPMDESLPSLQLKTLQSIKKSLLKANLITLNQAKSQDIQDIVIAYLPTFETCLKSGHLHYFKPAAIKDRLLDLHVTKDEYHQIHFAIDTIYQLLKNKVDINHIRIVNATREDIWLLHKEAKMYGFFVDAFQASPLDSHPLAIEFIKSLSHVSLETALEKLSDKIKTDSRLDTSVYDAFIQIINRHSLPVLEQNQELFLFEVEHFTLPPTLKTNVVTIEPLEYAFVHQDDYYLVLNYTDTLCPSLKKDNDFLSDDEKNCLHLRTSVQENELIMEDLRDRLQSLSHVTLVMPEKSGGKEIRRSDLFDQADLNIHHEITEMKTISGSKVFDYLDYAKKAYALKQYNHESFDYKKLHSTFSHIYQSYDPTFKGIKKDTLNQLLSQGFSFSPTNLERFNACRFRFLLDYLLKILMEDQTDSVLYGNLAHDVLSKTFHSSDTITNLGTKYLNTLNIPLSNSMDLHLKLFLKRLEIIVDYLKSEEKAATFDDFGFEIDLKAPINGHNDFTMKGKIDRVRTLTEGETTYFTVIDYKTGIKKFSFDQFEKGMDIQPLFYLNLLKKKYPEGFAPFGFFYQGVNLKRFNKEASGDALKQALKMNGVALNSTKLITQFSPNISITGIKINKEGTLGKSEKLVDGHTLDQMIENIDTLIEHAIGKIKQGDFSITPLAGKDDFDDSPACKYCPHAAVCFMKNRFVLTNDFESGEGE